MTGWSRSGIGDNLQERDHKAGENLENHRG